MAWEEANQARIASTDEKARRLAECISKARCFKEAAWMAGIPLRTATRIRGRLA